jgi:dihydroneopterin aldolase
MDTIFIEGLKTQAIIGIYDWERENRQPLIFDIEIDLPIATAAKTDDIADTVDYKTVSDEVIELVENSSYELLEKLCEDICQQILQNHKSVQLVRLRVSKPQAVPATDTVGIKITRYR